MVVDYSRESKRWPYTEVEKYTKLGKGLWKVSLTRSSESAQDEGIIQETRKVVNQSMAV